MIPTLIVIGLVFGHWWKMTLIVAAVGWPVLLVAAASTSIPSPSRLQQRSRRRMQRSGSWFIGSCGSSLEN